MVEAARYPSDFDGIIAGDPTFDYRGRTIRLYTTAKALLKSSGAYIDPRLLELVDRKIQQQCDASDGVKDGLIQNPAKCTFRAESLLCRNGNTAECLTEDQVGVLDHYLNAAKDERGLVASFGGPVSDIANSSLATDVEAAGPYLGPRSGMLPILVEKFWQCCQISRLSCLYTIGANYSSD
jgi:feruloyl esterase